MNEKVDDHGVAHPLDDIGDIEDGRDNSTKSKFDEVDDGSISNAIEDIP